MDAGSCVYTGVFLSHVGLLGGGRMSGPFRTFVNYNLRVAETQRDIERERDGETKIREQTQERKKYRE